jgi:hypothetical protein
MMIKKVEAGEKSYYVWNELRVNAFGSHIVQCEVNRGTSTVSFTVDTPESALIFTEEQFEAMIRAYRLIRPDADKDH